MPCPGIIGALTAGLFYGAGTFAQAFARGTNWITPVSALAHAAVGCASAEMSSGNCGQGALSAAISDVAATEDVVKPYALGTWGSYRSTAEAGLIGGVTSRIVGGKFEDGFSVAAAGYLFNSAAHSYEAQVQRLSQHLTNGQSAATLHFFNPNDKSPLSADQITPDATDLAAQYLVKATEVQSVANSLEGFANPFDVPDNWWSAFKGLVDSFFSLTEPQSWTWSTNIGTFNQQLTDRFGGAARSGPAIALSDQYNEIKQGI